MTEAPSDALPDTSTARPEAPAAAPDMQSYQRQIDELMNHNLALRCLLAMERPDLATLPGPDLGALQ